MSKLFHWDPPFAGAAFSWIPHTARPLMRRVFGLNLSQMVVMETLVSFRNQDPLPGEEYVVWMSVETLVERSGLTYDTAARVLRGLLKAGVIRQVSPPSRRRSRVYDLYNFLVTLGQAQQQAIVPAKLQVVNGGV